MKSKIRKKKKNKKKKEKASGKEEEEKEIKEVGGIFFRYFRHKIRVGTDVPSVT